jgi:hypothetical protein
MTENEGCLGAKILAGEANRDVDGPSIVRPYLEIAFGYDKFFGLYFSDIIWHYLRFDYFRDNFL